MAQSDGAAERSAHVTRGHHNTAQAGRWYRLEMRAADGTVLRWWAARFDGPLPEGYTLAFLPSEDERTWL